MTSDDLFRTPERAVRDYLAVELEDKAWVSDLRLVMETPFEGFQDRMERLIPARRFPMKLLLYFTPHIQTWESAREIVTAIQGLIEGIAIDHVEVREQYVNHIHYRGATFPPLVKVRQTEVTGYARYVAY